MAMGTGMKRIPEENETPRRGAWIWSIHPVLFALYPVLSLYAANLHEIPFSDTWRSILVVEILALFILLFGRVILRGWARAACFASIVLLVLLSYGHFYSFLKAVQIAGVPIGRHRYLVPLIALLFLGLLLWLRKRSTVIQLSQFLLVGAIALMAFPTIQIGNYAARTGFQGETDVQEQRSYLSGVQVEVKPDIYFIVLDAYSREDILAERFDYDNAAFLDALRERGFYVADQSSSNYLRTIYSITSTLNLNHLDELDVDLMQADYRDSLGDRLRESRVRQELESIGYTSVAFASSYLPTEIVNADYYIAPSLENVDAWIQFGVINDFEGFMLYNSIGRVLFDWNTIRGISLTYFLDTGLEQAKQQRRDIILSALENMTQLEHISAPKWVFAHIISPHYPYLFGPEGEATFYPDPLTFQEKQVVLGEQSWIGYRDQLIHINARILEMIDEIIANSETPPIILLQADHGPATGLDWTDPQEPYLTDRSSILNAYYLPDRCQQSLYPSISPVNSFRVVFNCLFGTSLDMLVDEAFIDQVVSGGVQLVPLDNFRLEQSP